MSLDCLYCHSDKIQKNGVLPRGGQRYNCKSCRKHFTLGGHARGTYDQTFKNTIVDMYCHLHTGARNIAEQFHISTSTLVGWAKQHKKNCTKCKQDAM